MGNDTGMEPTGARISLRKLEKNILHTHRGMEVLLVVKGNLQLELEGCLYHLSSDDVILINNQELHAIRDASDNVVLQLRVSQEFMEKECRELCGIVFFCNSVLSTEEDSASYFEIKRLLVRMLLAHSQKKDGYSLEYKGLLFQLFYHLKLHFQAEGTALSVLPQETRTASIAEIVSYINDNYHRSLSLKEMAGQAFMSPSYFSKYFKSKLGVRFFDYLTQVRMEHALSDLLNTKQSILSISLNNGFASAKSFAISFQRAFGQTPSEYRKTHAQVVRNWNEEESLPELAAGISGDMKELRKYIRRHNLEPSEQMEWGGKTEIRLGEPFSGQLSAPRLLINIGCANEVLKLENFEQLQIAQQKLHFHYVYFHSLLKQQTDLEEDDIFFSNHTCYQLLQSFRRLGLIPFWHVDFSLLEQTEASDGAEMFCGKLLNLLKFLRQSFSAHELSQWKIELACSNPSDGEDFLEFYLAVRDLFAQHFHGKVGLQTLFRNTPDEKKLLARVLDFAGERERKPDFVSFYGTFDTERLYSGISEVAFQKLGGYHRQLLEQIRAMMIQSGCETGEIYMPEWNTLSSRDMIQSGTFFRSALILDTLLSLGGISGAGFFLNTYAPTMLYDEADTSILALFLFFQAKRPVFFVLDALRRMGDKLLYRGKYVLATGNSDEFNILVYYPCYVDPMYSLDDEYVEYTRKRFLIELTGLKAGTYQFKRLTFDRDSAGIFRWWEKSGTFSTKDPDFIEYMNAMTPEIFLYTQQIDGSYSLSPTLSFNSIILYQVKLI